MQRSVPTSTADFGSSFGSLLDRLSFEQRLGVLFGIVMPVVSALVFPTYVHIMPQPWMERCRLLEFPFVLSELLVIGWAYRAGLDRTTFFAALSADVKIALAVLLAAMFLSGAVIARYPADAMAQSLIQVVHLYFAMAVYHLASTSPRGSLGGLIKPLAAGLAVLAVYTAYRFSFPPDPSTVLGGAIDWNFAVPGFISVRYLGTWCGAIAAALAIQVLYRSSNERVGIYHLFYVLAVAMMVWSGTRAAILGSGTTLLVFLFCQGLPRWRAIAVLAALTVLAVALAVLFRFDDPVFQLLASGDSTSVGKFTAGRTDLWLATIDRWRVSPLLGWGTGSIFYEVNIGWTHTQPHNAFLQFLISWGVVGATACCWLLGRAIYAAHITGMARRSEWPLLGLIYALLAMSMVDGALYYPRFIIMIVGGLALILGRATTQSDEFAARGTLAE